MNYDNFTKEQLISLINHLEENFIPDSVIFKSFALVSNKELTESIKLLQKQVEDTNKANKKLAIEVENLGFHMVKKNEQIEKLSQIITKQQKQKNKKTKAK